VSTLKDRRVAVLGVGKMGETLLRGLLEAGRIVPASVCVTARRDERAREVSERLGVRALSSNAEAAQGSDVILLCVKPPTVQSVLTEVRDIVGPDQLVVSVAAGVTLPKLEAALAPGVPVVRSMPNTPCAVGRGMTGLSAGTHASEEHVQLARTLFEVVGRAVVVDEGHMDAVTGLSASGPAFLYIVIESLAEAGVKCGLPRSVATELAAQTVVGAGSMVIERGEHPAALKDEVTTPAGCTMDGILELEDGGLRVALIKAVVKATERAGDLGR